MRKKYFLFLCSLFTAIVSYSQDMVQPTGSEDVNSKLVPSREKPIGQTNGMLDVNLTGAAVYTIPIQVPKGVNGIEPQISMTYNSQSGIGIAGIGWSISGISSISRIPSTLNHDGVVSAVNFTATDRFALDGQRLILKSGIYGGDGAEYQTENYSNLKITSHGVSPYGVNYGPKYFKVNYPDGSIALYGYKENSQSRIEFGLSSFKNASGVEIQYTYAQKGNRLLISTIKYVSKIKQLVVAPGTGGDLEVVAPKANDTEVGGQLILDNGIFNEYANEVRFVYSDEDMIKETSYIGGVKFENQEYLTKIEALSEGVVYREYFIEYDKDFLGYKLVSRVSEFNGGDTKELIPIRVEYNKATVDESNLVSTTVQPTNLEGDITANYFGAIHGDFDGDGVLDYIIYSKIKREYWLYYSTAGQAGQFVHKNEGEGVVGAIFPIQLKNAENEMLSYEGWLEIKGSKFSAKSFSKGIIKEEFTRTIDFPKFIIPPSKYTCNLGGEYDYPKNYYSGDFNGDGISDVIAIETSESFYVPLCVKPPFQTNGDYVSAPGGKMYLINLNENTTIPLHVGFISNYSSNSKIITGNFLGTNQTDLLVIDQGKMSLYSYNGTEITKIFEYSNERINLARQIHLGDFNGDGKTDIMFTKETRGNHVFYSTGTGFEYVLEDRSTSFYNGTVLNTVVKGVPGLIYTNYIATDFNNDGKTDFIAFKYIVRPEDYKVNPYATYVYKKGGALYSISFIKNEGNQAYSHEKTIELDVNNEGFDLIQSQNSAIQFAPIPIYLTPFSKFAYTTDNFKMGLFINQKMYTFEYKYNHAVDKLMKSVREGNNKLSIKYGQYGVKPNRPIDKTDFDYYMKYSNTKEKLPLLELNTIPNTYLVVEIKLHNNHETELKKSFSYASPVVDLKGLGFLGFKGVVSTNWYDKAENMYKTIKEFDTKNRGLLKKESVISGNQWDAFIPKTVTSPSGPILRLQSFLSIVDYEYQTELLASKVFKPRLSKVKETQLDGMNVSGKESFVKETTNTYNQYNDVIQQQVQYKQMHGLAMIGQPGFTVNKTETIENTYAYGAANSSYFMSRLVKSKQTQTIPGASSFSTEDSYVYDAKGRMVESIKKGNNTAETITEKNAFDQYGNVSEKRVKAGTLPERIETFKYGSFGRFLIEKTDVEGLKTTYTYNSKRGVITDEINALGQRTKFMYNNWQQLKSVIDYLGKISHINYLKTNTGFEITKTNDEGAWSKEKYDLNGNKVETSVKNLIGEIVHQSFEYDVYNRLIKESESYFGNTPALWNVTSYDKRGRVSKFKTSKGKEITTSYTINSIKVTDGISTKETKVNAAGHVIARKDEGGEITYTYFSNDNLKSATYDGVTITLEQDGWGRKTKLIDPSAGTYTYAYNAFGELIKETSPKGTTQFTFDNLGKLTKKQITGDHTNTEITYSYKADTKQLASSTAIVNGANYNYTYGYDSYNRLNKTTEVTPVATFGKELTFDDFGRLSEEKFTATSQGKSSAKRIKNQYKNGFHWQVLDALTNQVLVSKENTNEYDELTKLKLGNGLELTNAYDTYGYLQSNTVKKGTVTLFSLTNRFDTQRGNLLSRTNSLFNRTETFTYDNLDRLTSFTNKAGIQETQVYDNKGRITSNKIGDYSYASSASYQLESIDLDPVAQSYYQVRPEQKVLYNTFKNPVWIKEEGKENIYFDYNLNNQRSILYYGDLAATKEQSPLRRYYSADGNIEVNYNKTANKVEFVFYVDGDAYSATVIAKGENTPEYYYLHRDYLGSILAITNNAGNIVEKRHFDAWGNLVFVKDGQGKDLGQLTFLDRGYTGHEHLQGVALIHMNGRLYDPTVRRFLAPDNFVQDISNTQNFNRYGYVWNNPLLYTDQNGEVAHIIIGAVIGGLVNWGIHGFKMDASGLQAFGIGAAGGALGAATGGIAFVAMGGAAGGVGGFLAGAGSGVIAAYSQNLVLSIGNNALLGDKLLSLSEHLSSMAFGGLFSGIFNGVTALANGRSFMTGTASLPQVEAISMNAAGLASKAGDIKLSNTATIKSTPDLAYTNEVKNSVTKVVPLRAVDGGIQGGPLRIPDAGATVLDEITINAVSESGTRGLRPVGLFLESVNDVMANPSILRGKSYGFVRNVIGDSQNWVNDVMRKSTRAEGWMLREMNLRGTDYTGRMIQYHPGTPRHFGGTPYWKVSSGNGTFRIPLKF